MERHQENSNQEGPMNDPMAGLMTRMVRSHGSRGCVRGGATRAMAPGVFGSLLNKIGLLRKFPKMLLVVAPEVLKS